MSYEVTLNLVPIVIIALATTAINILIFLINSTKLVELLQLYCSSSNSNEFIYETCGFVKRGYHSFVNHFKPKCYKIVRKIYENIYKMNGDQVKITRWVSSTKLFNLTGLKGQKF